MQNQPPLFAVPDIIDNHTDTRRLATVLNTVLTAGSRVDVATAYFNVEGFALVQDALRNVGDFRLLLGDEPQKASDISRQLRRDIERGMERRETLDAVRAFVEFLRREDVQVRVYRKGFLHGKVYILDRLPMWGGIGIVGSSNFTRGGLTENSELNAVERQQAAVEQLKQWFNRFWDEADDYKQELVDLLNRFIESYPPYLIYMRALFEYFKDRLDLPAPDLSAPTAIELTEFQEDGYRNARAILERCGGVLIADSVGLGKTHVGLRFLDDYAYRERQKALVICPAQLRDTLWRPRLDRYRIYTVIRSQEEISQRDFDPAEFADCDLVLVDESHNFRSTSANRYDNLMRLLTTGKTKKLILMTATPVNNSLFDLYNQVRFITRDADDFFEDVGITSLWGYFLRADAERGDVFDLLEAVSVRRTRQFIKRNYPNATINGESINFPDRELHTVHYRLEDTYAGLYAECAQVIEGLKLAPYTLEEFRKDAPDKVESAKQRSLAGLLQMLYLKRLESSVTALRISFERQRDFQAKFLELLQRGKLLDSAHYRKIFVWAQSDESGEDEPDVKELINSLPEVDAKEYDLEDIRQAVQTDIAAIDGVLKKMQAAFGDDIAAKDAKLRGLKELLCTELKGKKVVVFTYFKDTARYLYHELGGPDRYGKRKPAGEEFLRRLGHERLRIVDSIVKPDERRDIIKRFSPNSNDAQHLKGTDEELDLLIATDVLSEGQNLQDADTVINYDLHWNPVRMIQRAGRIDRIGSPFAVVHLYNFFPEDKLEDLLNLMKRLREKIDNIRRTVGVDAKVLDPSELVDPKDFNALRDIEAEKQQVVDELEAQAELDTSEIVRQTLLDFLKRVGRAKLEGIPNGVGSGLRREDARGLFVYLRATPPPPQQPHRPRDFWCYYDLTKDRDHVTERKSDILKLIRCDEQTERADPDFDVYDLIARCKRHVVNRLKRHAAKPPTLKSPQNQVVNWLRAQPDQREVSDLLTYFAHPLPEVHLKGLRKVWRKQPNDVAALRAFAAAHPVAAPAVPEGDVLREDDLQVVCWMAVQ
ncbi:MAG: helicase-related protein [Abditibacteriales bacterium]|nr:helicase-related protein [Abditibacteriales bacterium]MDW8364832.1 helicase-related protein [Abditibacteriales bacterium]